MQNSKFSTALLFQLLTFGSILIFILLSVFINHHNHALSPLAKVAQVTDFQLTDSQNKPFHSAQLKGKIWIAEFFFTTCSGVCPVLNKNLSTVYRSYELDRRVHFVSITVNPDNDTPEVLANYAKKLKANPKNWHFLTGPSENIQNIANNILKNGNSEEPVFHSSYFVLVDAEGWIRGYFDGMTQEGTTLLFQHIAQLLKEKQ